MMTMITGFLGARLTNVLMLAPSSKMIFLTLTVVAGIIVVKKKNNNKERKYIPHTIHYMEKRMNIWSTFKLFIQSV